MTSPRRGRPPGQPRPTGRAPLLWLLESSRCARAGASASCRSWLFGGSTRRRRRSVRRVLVERLTGFGLLVSPRTRRWGAGMLIGFFGMLIVGAGALHRSWSALRAASADELTRRREDAAARLPGAPVRQCVLPALPRRASLTGRLPRCDGCRAGWPCAASSVWLERGCPDHGLVRTLYDESAEILTYLEQWTAPTKVHQPDVTGNFKPVPSAYEDGLPEMQTQHTCILLADITDHCNLRCPTCFAGLRARPWRSVAPLAEVLGVGRRPALPGERPHRRAHAVRRRADALPPARRASRGDDRSTGRPDPRQHQRPADRAGRRAARAAARGTGSGSRSTCSTTGESAEASTHHRGADIRRFKERALDRLSAAGDLHDADHDRRARA